MKPERTSLLLIGPIVLTLLSLFSGDSRAANYKGDRNCLSCHGPAMVLGAPDKSSYLMTGHKNMLRPVIPGRPPAGPDGTIYGTDDPYGSGSTFDWSSGTINVVLPDGSTDTRTLFFTFGGWMSTDELNTIYDGGFTGELYPHGSYDCGRCHTTGYRFDATGPLPTQTDAQFSRVPDGPGAPTTSSWYLHGIQCERCHRDAVNDVSGHNCYDSDGHLLPYSFGACASHGGTLKVVVPTFGDATKQCLECHRQEYMDPAQNVLLVSPLAIEVSDEGSCSDSEYTDQPACAANGGTWNYAPVFDASIGQTFLNSPHARFSGTLSQNAQSSADLSVVLTGSYGSNFGGSCSIQEKAGKEGAFLTPAACLEAGGTWTAARGGCTTCHDVHQSTVAAVNATAPITKQCDQCHGLKMNQIGHPMDNPKGPRTCETCHMPDGSHLLRINTDADYATYPTVSEFYAGQTTGNTAPDGAQYEGTWIDLDLACGQCHGGGTDEASNPAAWGVRYLTKVELAQFARKIHKVPPGQICP